MAKGHDLLDGGVIHEHGVDLERCHLLAAAIDDLLEAAGEVQIALGVEHPLIAGAKPPGSLGREEGGGVGRRVADISGGHVGGR